jgi:Xanthine and CO dehydrogenases maturation factor, XdhC/CoxF family
MKEIRDIIRAFDNAEKQGKATALATVVHVDGSSYRRPGARMLITEDGELTGAISGGCLEGDALRKALLVLIEKRSMLVTYDTMDEDDAKFGVGLGCNGIIQVLIEPINAAQQNNPIQLLKAVASRRQKAVLVTLFSMQNKKDPQPGTFLLLKEDNSTAESGDVISLKNILLEDAKTVMLNQSSIFKNYITEQQNITSFIEFVKPPVALVVIGAGNDVIPMVNMAAILGWDTTIVDGRANYAKPERFISTCQVLLSKPENVLEKINIDEQTVFVLMTHNYNYDMAMLNELIKRDVVYIGMLGPKKKLDRMLDELKENGVNISGKQLSMIYGPAGLEIGAETSEEIALSILAEIKAVLAGKQGQSLRNRSDAIHPVSETAIQQVNLVGKSSSL